MRINRRLLLLFAAAIAGCTGPEVPPREAVVPYVHWDASYAESLAIINSGVILRGGMIKVMFEFPEFDVEPDWIKADVEFSDGALARMDIIVRKRIYIAQAPGLSPENDQVIHVQWLTPGYEVGHYRILVRDYQLRPLPGKPPVPKPPLPVPPPPPPPPPPTPSYPVPEPAPGELTRSR